MFFSNDEADEGSFVDASGMRKTSPACAIDVGPASSFPKGRKTTPGNIDYQHMSTEERKVYQMLSELKDESGRSMGTENVIKNAWDVGVLQNYHSRFSEPGGIDAPSRRKTSPACGIDVGSASSFTTGRKTTPANKNHVNVDEPRVRWTLPELTGESGCLVGTENEIKDAWDDALLPNYQVHSSEASEVDASGRRKTSPACGTDLASGCGFTNRRKTSATNIDHMTVEEPRLPQSLSELKGESSSAGYAKPEIKNACDVGVLSNYQVETGKLNEVVIASRRKTSPAHTTENASTSSSTDRRKTSPAGMDHMNVEEPGVTRMLPVQMDDSGCAVSAKSEIINARDVAVLLNYQLQSTEPSKVDAKNWRQTTKLQPGTFCDLGQQSPEDNLSQDNHPGDHSFVDLLALEEAELFVARKAAEVELCEYLRELGVQENRTHTALRQVAMYVGSLRGRLCSSEMARAELAEMVGKLATAADGICRSSPEACSQ